MVPNIYIAMLVREHCHELQSEAEHQRTLANLHRPSSSLIRRQVGRLGGFLMELGLNLKEFEQHGETVMYDL